MLNESFLVDYSYSLSTCPISPEHRVVPGGSSISQLPSISLYISYQSSSYCKDMSTIDTVDVLCASHLLGLLTRNQFENINSVFYFSSSRPRRGAKI